MRFKLSFPTAIAVLMLLTLATTRSAHAQSDGSEAPPTPYTCDAPCGGDSTVWPWQYPPGPYATMLSINGCQFNNPPTCCTVTAKYRYRQVCGRPGFYQIEITSLSWDKDCQPAFDPVPMIKVITYGLLKDNPMGFPPRIGFPNDPQCLSNYTVQAATCWKNLPGMKAAENCAVDTAGYACCKGGYQVCMMIGSNGPYRQVNWLGQSTVWNNCVAPCAPSCGAFQEDGIWNKRKDNPTPSLSMAPVSGSTDTVTVSNTPTTIEQKTTLAPQQR